MNTWFIYNGIKSNDMGIVLAKTPPITRASKRHNLIEIDGIDGCSIDELGYSAYEKIIEIGIKNIKKLPQIMDWLTGYGNLTLWNEPDMYYDVSILNQIDYSRVLRFATAKIAFLVQPYKYSTIDDRTESLVVENKGNTIALPYMEIYGSGSVTLSINDRTICTLNMNASDCIVLDSVTKDAYRNGALANRSMNGEFPEFRIGSNIISFTGNVTKIITKVRSRWL